MVQISLTIVRQRSHNDGVVTRYSIRAVSEETGLSVHTLRAWERRYGVPVPVRTDTNRRVYDLGEVQRLKYLHQAVTAGHSIGLIASLSIEDLSQLVRTDVSVKGAAESDTPADFVRLARHAVDELDTQSLQSTLERALMVLGADAFVDSVVSPLMGQVGKSWAEGDVSIAQEHMATAIVKAQLHRIRLSMQPSRGAPAIIVGAPAGQQHEVGALVAAAVASRMDWKVTYLGANLPAAEFVGAVHASRALVLAISLVHPHGDPVTATELSLLGALLPREVRVLAGGDATESYREQLEGVKARVCPDMESFRERLSELRSSAMLRA